MPNLHLHLHPCTCKSFSSSIPVICFVVPHKSIQTRITSISCSKTPNSYSTVSIAGISKIPTKVSVLRRTHVSFCSPNDDFEEISSEEPENEREELELRGKPSPLPVNGNASSAQIEPTRLDKDEVLEPFLKFFKAKDDIINVKQQVQEEEEEEEEEGGAEEVVAKKNKVDVEFYEPKPGDFVVGVVVSGNENKLDLNIGADLLGTMLTKEVLPLYDKDLPYLLCDIEKDCKEFMVRGKMGIFFDEDAVSGKPMPGRPIVEIGTVLFAEVLGRTLSGRPLLSTRRFFRRVAWHRVRQIKQLNEPIEVRITEWNTGGLLTRIEGLRGFIPKMELINRVNTFTDLKENVGRKIFVQITRIDETNNDLILSEREAWEMTYLREGTLLEGTVRKIFPYGAQVRIGDTNRSGLLHISNITRARIDSVSELLMVNEKVKALVVKSMFPDKISLSIAELESEPGLFVSNKEKVFSEAEEMAKKYRQKSPATFSKHKLHSQPTDFTPFHDEEKLYSNWKWFKFERSGE